MTVSVTWELSGGLEVVGARLLPRRLLLAVPGTVVDVLEGTWRIDWADVDWERGEEKEWNWTSGAEVFETLEMAREREPRESVPLPLLRRVDVCELYEFWLGSRDAAVPGRMRSRGLMPPPLLVERRFVLERLPLMESRERRENVAFRAS